MMMTMMMIPGIPRGDPGPEAGQEGDPRGLGSQIICIVIKPL